MTRSRSKGEVQLLDDGLAQRDERQRVWRGHWQQQCEGVQIGSVDCADADGVYGVRVRRYAWYGVTIAPYLLQTVTIVFNTRCTLRLLHADNAKRYCYRFSSLQHCYHPVVSSAPYSHHIL